MDTLTRIRTFLQVVDEGGFSAAARATGRSKALISKYVRELEDELGVRLLNRTTRKLSPTEAGSAYYAEAQVIVQQLDDLKASVQDRNADASGRLKIAAPQTTGEGELGRAIMEFAVAHPQISIEMHTDDRFVDIVEEGFDVAIRITKLADSSLIARRLAPFRIVTCASPSFIEAHGMPQTPADLTRMPCIIDTNTRMRNQWPFLIDGRIVSVSIKGRIQVNSPMAGRQAALAGLGAALIPRILVSKDLEEGNLVPVLEAYAMDELGVYALYPHRRHLSGKVRAFVDFLADWFTKHRELGL